MKHLTAVIFFVALAISADSLSLSIHPVFSMKNHIHPSTRPLADRIGVRSAIVLDRLKKMDNRENYSFYDPAPLEKKEVISAIEKLPPLSRKILDERLTGIYFVNNLLGSGLTEWIDFNGDAYCFMAYNPSILNKGLSELLTEKELTCFVRDDKETGIKINCGGDEKGSLYIIAHEAVHAVDYAMRLTPYTDSGFKDFYGIKTKDTPFTAGLWKSYSETSKNYPFRKDITFYGFSGGPKIAISSAEKRYRALAASPFVSLYSAQNWAEDLAEYATFYHITKVMRIPYSIEVFRGKEIVYRYEPFKNAAVHARSARVKLFYQSFPEK